jgi:4-hydroxybenzoate-CoA ligase
MFKVSGIRVLPFEVEAALIAPRLLEAAVVPAEDANGLMKLRIFVVLKDESEDRRSRGPHNELKLHVKRTIGQWKHPRGSMVDRMPKTATGKIQRFMLRAEAPAPDAGDGGQWQARECAPRGVRKFARQGGS